MWCGGGVDVWWWWSRWWCGGGGEVEMVWLWRVEPEGRRESVGCGFPDVTNRLRWRQRGWSPRWLAIQTGKDRMGERREGE